MTTNASRIPVDYDGFDGDRQPAPVRPAPKGDPLAELARIVGQDDPFRALLDVREGRKPAEAPAAGGRIDPVVPTYAAGPAYDSGPAPSYAPQATRRSVPRRSPAPPPMPSTSISPAPSSATTASRSRRRTGCRTRPGRSPSGPAAGAASPSSAAPSASSR